LVAKLSRAFDCAASWPTWKATKLLLTHHRSMFSSPSLALPLAKRPSICTRATAPEKPRHDHGHGFDAALILYVRFDLLGHCSCFFVGERQNWVDSNTTVVCGPSKMSTSPMAMMGLETRFFLINLDIACISQDSAALPAAYTAHSSAIVKGPLSGPPMPLMLPKRMTTCNA